MFGIQLRRRRINDLNLALSPEEVRKRARILVIDDDERAFPAKLLENEGYNVRYWAKVENLRELEKGEYDIIVLDIEGVSSPELSKRDGLGVLEHLKRYNPAQIVIAYSGRSFDLGQQRFFQLADDFLTKPSDLLECKEKIDRLLQTKFTALHYWSTLVDILRKSEVPQKKIAGFERLFIKNAESGKHLSVDAIVNVLNVTKEVAEPVFTLLGLIMKFWSAP
jgi:CheY-like chemotaxis protein